MLYATKHAARAKTFTEKPGVECQTVSLAFLTEMANKLPSTERYVRARKKKYRVAKPRFVSSESEPSAAEAFFRVTVWEGSLTGATRRTRWPLLGRGICVARFSTSTVNILRSEELAWLALACMQAHGPSDCGRQFFSAGAVFAPFFKCIAF